MYFMIKLHFYSPIHVHVHSFPSTENPIYRCFMHLSGIKDLSLNHFCIFRITQHTFGILEEGGQTIP